MNPPRKMPNVCIEGLCKKKFSTVRGLKLEEKKEMTDSIVANVKVAKEKSDPANRLSIDLAKLTLVSKKAGN